MKQGEIWYADLSPVIGSEQAGKRPVVIISGNLLNEYLPLVICMPLTTKIKGYKGNIILEPNAQNGLKQKSEVLSFHIRSISKNRLLAKTGNITADEIELLKKYLGEILTY
jgi:mRNA interferase MazF